MINRDLKVSYNINEDKVNVNVLETIGTTITSKTRVYNLIEFTKDCLVYNKMLHDFSCEYDDALANMLDIIVNEIVEKI